MKKVFAICLLAGGLFVACGPSAEEKAKAEAEEEAVDEPEKRKPAAKASAVPQKKAGSLASTVDEWDDE